MRALKIPRNDSYLATPATFQKRQPLVSVFSLSIRAAEDSRKNPGRSPEELLDGMGDICKLNRLREKCRPRCNNTCRRLAAKHPAVGAARMPFTSIVCLPSAYSGRLLFLIGFPRRRIRARSQSAQRGREVR